MRNMLRCMANNCSSSSAVLTDLSKVKSKSNLGFSSRLRNTRWIFYSSILFLNKGNRNSRVDVPPPMKINVHQNQIIPFRNWLYILLCRLTRYSELEMSLAPIHLPNKQSNKIKVKTKPTNKQKTKSNETNKTRNGKTLAEKNLR